MCGYICAYVSTVFLCLCTMPIGDHLNLQSHKKQAEGGKKNPENYLELQKSETQITSRVLWHFRSAYVSSYDFRLCHCRVKHMTHQETLSLSLQQRLAVVCLH